MALIMVLAPNPMLLFLTCMVIPSNISPLSPDFLSTLMFDVPIMLNCPSAIAIAGFCWTIFFRRLMNRNWASGITLLAKKKDTKAKIPMVIVSIFIARCNEIPDDFIAANS